MKNTILVTIIAITFILGGIYLINASRTTVEATDEFGLEYQIEKHIYVDLTLDDLFSKMDNEETFILFIGRPSCPYCKQTVPVLNDVAVEYGYDEIYYMNSEQEDISNFIYSQGIQGVPFTAFIQNGVSVFSLPGFVELDVMEQIFSELH